VYEEGDFVMLMPFLRREVGLYYDFETPYGYGGPIFNDNSAILIEKALITMIAHFKECNYIAGFVRFHPLLENANQCKDVISVINDRQTVVMDLSLSEEDIWQKEISTKNRNTIRKAEKVGLAFEADYEFRYIDEFVRLYTTTMQRLSADEYYHFSADYYRNLVNLLSNNGFLGVVKMGKEIISAAIFMYYLPYGHYHLSGSNKEQQRLCPNNLLLFEAAKELKKLGALKFHLGGGSDSNPENSLLEFKSRFGYERYQFSIGKMIFNNKAYQTICDQWTSENPDKIDKYKSFLLKYRY
jgi:lipid II:glycine glycyltransferase (peptidoglycan interpeptide bridge formation enzyme)